MTRTSLARLWRETAWILGSIGAAMCVSLVAAIYAVFAVDMENTDAGMALFGFIAIVLGVGCGVSMFWRRSKPLLVLVTNVIVGVLFPISTLGALITLPWVIAKSSQRTAALSTLGVGAASALILFMDWRKPVHRTVFSDQAGPPTGDAVLLWWGYLLLWLMSMIITVSLGMVRRYNAAAGAAQQSAQRQQEVATNLRGELSRKEERELIAREMHDTVAHQLSLISMQAGVLEVTTSDPNVPDSARQMRQSVHRALDEMRVLISSLRDSQGSGYTGATPDFVALNLLLAEAHQAGAKVNADIQIDEQAVPTPRLTSAVYRIVQEGLTNAIKYGTDAPILIRVYAGPVIGVFIDVINQIDPVAARERRGAHAGLPGMQERAALLGGTLTYQDVSGYWRVTAQLPWSTQ